MFSVKIRRQRLQRRLLSGALLALLCGGVAQAQTGTAPETRADTVEAVERALKDPALALPGQTLRDVGVPTQALSLKSALRRALTQHPDLVQALANVESQQFGVTIATSNYYPKFDFSASAGQSGSEGQPGGSSVIRTGLQRSYGLGIRLSQQLLDFGRTRYRVKIQELELASTRLTYIQLRQTVINNVVQAYFNLLRQAQAIEVGLENVRNAELLVEQARGFLEAGTRAKIEVIRAEADLATAKFELVRAQGGYGRARAALASALGEDELPQELPEPFSLPTPEWDVDQVRALARRGRPELLIAGLRVAQAEARVGAARAEYYPTISANASYNWNDTVFPPVNTSYNVGVSLSVPILNEPELSATVNQAVANLKSATAGLESSELTVVQSATEALYTLREAQGSAESAGEGLRAAEETFRLASERYRVGVGTSLEVSQAQQALVQARSVELQARYDVQTAIGTLLQTTGQLDGEALLDEDLRLEPIFDLPAEILPTDGPQFDIPKPKQTLPPKSEPSVESAGTSSPEETPESTPTP